MPKEGEASNVDDLATLAACPRRVEVYTFDKDTDARITRKIRVAPMTFDMLGEVAVSLREIVESIGVDIRPEDLARLIAEHYKAVRAIVATCTAEPEAYVGSLPADQMLYLAGVVFEVNRAFFVHHVGPMAKSLAAKMFGGAGLTLSTASPSTATPTP
jgi:hypothetical protein